MSRKKFFLLGALLAFGIGIAAASDVSVTYKGTTNSVSTVTTSTADLATIDSPSSFAGRILACGNAPNVTVGAGFTNASATSAIWLVRGNVDANGTFRPSGLATSATLTADGTVKIAGLYVAPTLSFDTAGFNACFVAIGSISAGTVTIYEAAH